MSQWLDRCMSKNAAMDNKFHSELMIHEDTTDADNSTPQSSGSSKTPVPDSPEGSIGIRPLPMLCKPENIDCKSEPIETKWHWAPGAWQDATRTSAFQPYKVCFNSINEKKSLNTSRHVTILHSATDFADKSAKRQYKDSDTSALRIQWHYLSYTCWPGRT